VLRDAGEDLRRQSTAQARRDRRPVVGDGLERTRASTSSGFASAAAMRLAGVHAARGAPASPRTRACSSPACVMDSSRVHQPDRSLPPSFSSPLAGSNCRYTTGRLVGPPGTRAS
jgi:hypothetical protein